MRMDEQKGLKNNSIMDEEHNSTNQQPQADGLTA